MEGESTQKTTTSLGEHASGGCWDNARAIGATAAGFFCTKKQLDVDVAQFGVEDHEEDEVNHDLKGRRNWRDL